MQVEPDTKHERMNKEKFDWNYISAKRVKENEGMAGENKYMVSQCYILSGIK